MGMQSHAMSPADEKMLAEMIRYWEAYFRAALKEYHALTQAYGAKMSARQIRSMNQYQSAAAEAAAILVELRT